MNQQPAGRSENERSDYVLQRAMAAIKGETVPPGPPPELVAATLYAIQDQRVFAAIDESPTDPSAHPISRRYAHWRKVMSRPVPRFAATALAAASVGAVYFLTFGTSATTSFAQMVDSIIKAKTVRYSVGVEGHDMPKQTFQALILEPGRLRQELPDGQVQIIDSSAGKMMTLIPAQKSALLVKFTAAPAPGKPVDFFDQLRTSLLAVRDGASSNMEPLGRKEIDGRQAEGFRLKTADYEATMWGDPKTGRPILVEMTFAPLPDMKVTMSHFEFDVELDASLFSLEPPGEYSVQQVSIGTPTEQDLIETLKLLSDHNHGTFPDALDNGAVVACMTDLAAHHKPGSPGSAEGNKLFELALALNQGIAFAVALPAETGARYAGKGIKRGDATAGVFWYRPVGASAYRVIYADLAVKEQAAAPESTSGVPVNAGPSVITRMRDRMRETLSKAKERSLLPAEPRAVPPAEEPPVVPRAAAAMPNDPVAQRIIDRMAKAYGECQSYRDSGTVTTLFVQETGNRTTERPFTTAFVRPGRLRFEYKDMTRNPPTSYLIWTDGQEVQTWWDVRPGIEKPGSLGLALGGANGVSGGSAITMPSLLMPDELRSGPLTHLTGAKCAEDGTLGTNECFRIESTYGQEPMTVWIDKQSYLVRRIDTQMKFPNFRTEVTTTYDPTVDEQVSDEMLEFDPPVQK